MRPERLVHYSLTLADGQRPDLVGQFGASARTLRVHNRAIPVVLFLYGARDGGARRRLPRARPDGPPRRDRTSSGSPSCAREAGRRSRATRCCTAS